MCVGGSCVGMVRGSAKRRVPVYGDERTLVCLCLLMMTPIMAILGWAPRKTQLPQPEFPLKTVNIRNIKYRYYTGNIICDWSFVKRNYRFIFDQSECSNSFVVSSCPFCAWPHSFLSYSPPPLSLTHSLPHTPH